MNEKKYILHLEKENRDLKKELSQLKKLQKFDPKVMRDDAMREGFRAAEVWQAIRVHPP